MFFSNKNEKQSTFIFHGDKIAIIKRNDGLFVSIKHLTKGMGLNWPAQWAKIKRNNSSFNSIKISLNTCSGLQVHCCLRASKINAWIESIKSCKIENNAKKKIVIYKNSFIYKLNEFTLD